MRSAFRTATVFGALVAFVMPRDVLPQTPNVPPLTSNRPGIADSEALVSSGAFQVEAGVLLQGSTRRRSALD